MIPFGAIGVVAFLIARALKAKREGGTPAATTTTPQISRGSSTAFSDPGAAGTLVWQLMLLGFAGGFLAGAIELQSLVMVTCSFASLWLLFPAWLGRVVFAPLGFTRLAYFSGWLSRIEWRRDKPGGPALLAAWSLVQQATPKVATIAWVEGKLGTPGKALQGSGVVARGLLEAAKGNFGAAREWLESVALFDPRVSPPQVRRVAAEWLATDAAARGDWERLKDLTSAGKWPHTRTLTLLNCVAKRMLGHASPGDLELWVRWLLAPRRVWTWTFVRTASRRPASTHFAPSLPRAPAELSALAKATWLTVALQRSETRTVRALSDVAWAWERALDGELRNTLFARATLTGGGEPDAALEEVRALVKDALAPLLPSRVVGLSNPPALVESAMDTRHRALQAELEDKMSRMDARKVAGREFPALEEWQEFLTLRRLFVQASEASRNQGDVALVFSIIRDKAVNYAVWLYNVRTERCIANAIFRMLEAQAVLLGDSESERLNKKNAGCDL